MTIDNQPALSRISAYLRANMVRSNASRLTPFTVSLDAGSAEPCRNYAMPDDHAEADPASIMALICLFKARRRIPRFEYFPEMVPDLLLYLQWEGFRRERALPVMAGMEAVGPKLEDIPDIEWHLTRSPKDLAMTAQLPGSDGELLRQTVRDGGTVALVRSRQTGQLLAKGLIRPASDGVTEIAAIGLGETAVRHGMQSVLAAFLTRHAIDAGVGLPFLMAASDEEARFYATAGFRRVGTMMHSTR